MKILFEIALFCFAALVWAAFSALRHIRRHTAVDAALRPALVPRIDRTSARRHGSSLAA